MKSLTPILEQQQPKWQAIAAMAENRAIGRDNDLPWKLPEDLRWFMRKTQGHCIVMGRKTWESFPSLLPRRRHYVISRTMPQPDNASITVLPSLDALREVEIPEGREIWIIGGGMIYELALPYCSDLWLTRVHVSVADAQVFFPVFEDMFERVEIVAEFEQFHIEHWKRRGFSQA